MFPLSACQLPPCHHGCIRNGPQWNGLVWSESRLLLTVYWKYRRILMAEDGLLCDFTDTAKKRY